MYGQCNKKFNILLGEVFENCYTPNEPPKKLSESGDPGYEELLTELQQICPQLFPSGNDGDNNTV